MLRCLPVMFQELYWLVPGNVADDDVEAAGNWSIWIVLDS